MMFSVIDVVSRVLGITRKGKKTKEMKNHHAIPSTGGIPLSECY